MEAKESNKKEKRIYNSYKPKKTKVNNYLNIHFHENENLKKCEEFSNNSQKNKELLHKNKKRLLNNQGKVQRILNNLHEGKVQRILNNLNKENSELTTSRNTLTIENIKSNLPILSRIHKHKLFKSNFGTIHIYEKPQRYDSINTLIEKNKSLINKTSTYFSSITRDFFGKKIIIDDNSKILWEFYMLNNFLYSKEVFNKKNSINTNHYPLLIYTFDESMQKMNEIINSTNTIELNKKELNFIKNKKVLEEKKSIRNKIITNLTQLTNNKKIKSNLNILKKNINNLEKKKKEFINQKLHSIKKKILKSLNNINILLQKKIQRKNYLLSRITNEDKNIYKLEQKIKKLKCQQETLKKKDKKIDEIISIFEKINNFTEENKKNQEKKINNFINKNPSKTIKKQSGGVEPVSMLITTTITFIITIFMHFIYIIQIFFNYAMLSCNIRMKNKSNLQVFKIFMWENGKSMFITYLFIILSTTIGIFAGIIKVIIHKKLLFMIIKSLFSTSVDKTIDYKETQKFNKSLDFLCKKSKEGMLDYTQNLIKEKVKNVKEAQKYKVNCLFLKSPNEYNINNNYNNDNNDNLDLYTLELTSRENNIYRFFIINLVTNTIDGYIDANATIIEKIYLFEENNKNHVPTLTKQQKEEIVNTAESITGVKNKNSRNFMNFLTQYFNIKII